MVLAGLSFCHLMSVIVFIFYWFIPPFSRIIPIKKIYKTPAIMALIIENTCHCGVNYIHVQI
jgi:hypothetical protein